MKISSTKIFGNSQFQVFLLGVGLLFLVQWFLGKSESLPVLILVDAILFVIIFSLSVSMFRIFSEQSTKPLSLVMSIGILNALLFFMIMFSDTFLSLMFGNNDNFINAPKVIYAFVLVMYGTLIVGFLVYVFLSLRHLFFLRQSRNLNIYFITMTVFFVLAAICKHFFDWEGISFLGDTFLIVSILLVFFNSLKISWIAFIVKKEKIYLLILSIVIITLFVLNLTVVPDDSAHMMMLTSLSPSLKTFNTIILLYGAIYFSILFFTTLFHLPTAEAFDRKSQEISSLQYFSKLITQVLDFNDLADTVTDLTLRVSNADAAWIIWKEFVNDKENYNSIAAKNIGFLDSELLNKYIIKKRKWDQFEDTMVLNFDNFDQVSKVSQNFKSAAISPLKTHNEIRGLLIAARKSDRLFTEEDKTAIATFSDYASVSLENSRLFEESIEKERLEKELDVAREIQKKILPEKNPEYEGLQVSTVFIPAFEVGGDYYDFFKISDDKLGFIIADVSGKGISAAFIMAEVKGIFESLSKIIQTPQQILIKANEILKQTLDSKTFVSAAYGLIDFKNETLQLARAGHCPILLIRDNSAETIKPSGMGLGLSNTNQFSKSLSQLEINLQEDDTIILYTDGITEAKNENLDDFGEEYFTEILMENRDKDAELISKSVMKEITVFSKNHSQYDDITLVILKWNPRKNSDGQKIKIDGEQEWQNSAPR
jgi:phosphoserine phosphatase RsbU/P